MSARKRPLEVGTTPRSVAAVLRSLEDGLPWDDVRASWQYKQRKWVEDTLGLENGGEADGADEVVQIAKLTCARLTPRAFSSRRACLLPARARPPTRAAGLITPAPSSHA